MFVLMSVFECVLACVIAGDVCVCVLCMSVCLCCKEDEEGGNA